MDLATIIGIVSAFALVIIAMTLGGSILMFIDLTSILIVVGGTIGVTLINYPLRDVLKLVGIVKHVFLHKLVGVPQIIAQFVEFATKARREGILALEGSMKEVEDPFLQKGLQLTIDGLEPNNIKEILETEIDYVAERHRLGAEIFLTMGTFSPALGMIGTLIGGRGHRQVAGSGVIDIGLGEVPVRSLIHGDLPDAGDGAGDFGRWRGRRVVFLVCGR